MPKTFEILNRGRNRMQVLVDGEHHEVVGAFREGFLHIMDLRGWTAQQTYDHLMRSKLSRPWCICRRLGNSLIRNFALYQSLRPLHVSRSSAGVLQAWRWSGPHQSFTVYRAPHAWEERYSHVEANAVHDEAGEYLYAMGDRPSYQRFATMARGAQAAA